MRTYAPSGESSAPCPGTTTSIARAAGGSASCRAPHAGPGRPRRRRTGRHRGRERVDVGQLPRPRLPLLVEVEPVLVDRDRAGAGADRPPRQLVLRDRVVDDEVRRAARLEPGDPSPLDRRRDDRRPRPACPSGVRVPWTIDEDDEAGAVDVDDPVRQPHQRRDLGELDGDLPQVQHAVGVPLDVRRVRLLPDGHVGQPVVGRPGPDPGADPDARPGWPRARPRPGTAPAATSPTPAPPPPRPAAGRRARPPRRCGRPARRAARSPRPPPAPPGPAAPARPLPRPHLLDGEAEHVGDLDLAQLGDEPQHQHGPLVVGRHRPARPPAPAAARAAGPGRRSSGPGAAAAPRRPRSSGRRRFRSRSSRSRTTR